MTPAVDAPLVDHARLERLLDELGFGEGPITAEPLGDGHSNLTFLLSRRGHRCVLRRPPRPPYPPSAHDVIREATIVEALDGAGVPVPTVLAKVEDSDILGVPFVLMEFVDGVAISNDLPSSLDSAEDRDRIGRALVDALVGVHDVDITQMPLRSRAGTSDYLQRQLARFSKIRDSTRIRSLPGLDEVAEWLVANRPSCNETTLVHGDFRIGNVLFARESPARLSAILDWELAALGDPLADLGYLCATWAEPADPEQPMLALSGATRRPGFLTRAELADRYSSVTGRDVSSLPWYEVLAMWKAAIFLEASYGRFVAGAAKDPYFASLEHGVPRIAAVAWERVHDV